MPPAMKKFFKWCSTQDTGNVVEVDGESNGFSSYYLDDDGDVSGHDADSLDFTGAK